MNAVPQTKTPVQASYQFAKPMLDKGFKADRLHVYCTQSGEPIYYRIRLRHPKGEKWIRPFHHDGHSWRAGEPKFPVTGKPLFGLERLGADATTPVYVVEGERVCEELWKLDITAVTSGSSSSAQTADWSPLTGRHVVIWPDNDEPGFAYKTKVIEKLATLNCSIEVTDVIALGLNAGEDAVDWLKANPDATADDVHRLARNPAEEKQKSQKSHAPEPLHRAIGAAEPYPLISLGEILGPACESLRRVIQAPDAICGSSLLAAASLAVQGLADVDNDGRIHPLSLWMLTVAESGERKSGVDREVMRAVREHEKKLFADYSTAQEEHQRETEEWAARKDRIKRDNKNADGLAQSLRDLGSPPLEPLCPALTVSDFTGEGVAKLLATGLPSVGAFTDEAALVFGGHGMNKESVARTAATFCKLWDSGELNRVRAGDGAMKLWGRRFAIHLLAQPVIAERALSDSILSGQGFLARCLLAWPEGTAGTRAYKAERLTDDPALIRFTERLKYLLSKPLPLAAGQRNELQPRILRLSEEAFETWRKAHDAIESEMADSGRYTIAKPWASKMPEQCLRIAGVLTLLEDPAADVINDAVIRRSIRIALWHLGEAVRLAGIAQVPDDIRNAQTLLDWCHKTQRDVLYSTEVFSFGPRAIRDNNLFREAIQTLEKTEWAVKIEGGLEIGGVRRKHVWRIVRTNGAR